MSIKSRRVLALIVVFSLMLFGILCMFNSKENKEDLVDVVETTYEQAMKGENISYKQTWKIAELYNDGVKNLSEAEWDELDRKINVIADSCEFDSSNPDSPLPFRPVVKELRHDKPAGHWAGPID